jgi:hypothetical protein
MRDDDRSSQEDHRYEARAKLRLQQLASADSMMAELSAEDVERRLRRKRVGRKLPR